MGILEVLTIIFVVLKAIGQIDWSWWQVFIPMYIAVVIYIGAFAMWFKAYKKIQKEHKEFRKDFFNNF